MRSRIITLAIAAVVTSTAGQAQTITRTLDTGAPYAGFGKGGIETVGQTFTSPGAATALQGFNFFLSNDLDDGGNGANLSFEEYVMRWDAVNSVPTGPVLFQSSAISGSGDDTFGSFAFGIPVDGISVSPNDTYVAFLTTVGVPASEPDYAFNSLGGSDDTSLGGSFVASYYQGDDYTGLLSDAWYVADEGTNAAFTAQFASNTSTVPEPSELVLVATGLLGIAPMLRRKRRV
jgi:hypothetical protein